MRLLYAHLLQNELLLRDGLIHLFKSEMKNGQNTSLTDEDVKRLGKLHPLRARRHMARHQHVQNVEVTNTRVDSGALRKQFAKSISGTDQILIQK